jgi:myb proto-oncogene protein
MFNGNYCWKSILDVLLRSYGWTKRVKPKVLRERWQNHLDPKLRKDPWTPEEDCQLFSLIQKYGKRWSKLAKEMSIRNEHQVKNRWL